MLIFRASRQAENPVLYTEMHPTLSFKPKLTEVNGKTSMAGFMEMYAIFSLLLVLVNKGSANFWKIHPSLAQKYGFLI